MKLKNNVRLLITCDSGAGAGKTTAAKYLSKRYGLNLLTSGLLYRMVAQKLLVSKKKVTKWLTLDREDWIDNGMVHGWDRNQELIDFEFIPPTIILEIMEQYNGQTPPNRSGLLNYFVKHKLKMLIEHIGDF